MVDRDNLLLGFNRLLYPFACFLGIVEILFHILLNNLWGFSMQCHLVTGGAGFIGSCYALLARKAGIRVVNLDKLTYSGNLGNLRDLEGDSDHIFVHGDIGNTELTRQLLAEYTPDAVVNFAAESHVDRSIHDPEIFVKTNVLGTVSLLQTSLQYWCQLDEPKKERFKFLHVSTDEVYGALKPDEPPFTEKTPYAPNSPYSASKASADHFARAFFETYSMPVLITNCSNNYGPRQFPEKLIPLTLVNALAGKEIPIYGTGENIRDWLHVEDHCLAIMRVINQGQNGLTYAIGGRAERTNIEVVRAICRILDELVPSSEGPYERLMKFVSDRLGHDWRYAIDSSFIEESLDWQQQHSFEQGLRETVEWYLDNQDWVEHVQTGAYREWLEKNYVNR